jgi:hypothetical protein
MLKLHANRRGTRSENLLEALEHQLAASTQRARFSSMVVADELGLVIAGAGNDRIGEQVAAISPMLARDMNVWHGTVRTNKGEVRLSVAPIKVGKSQLYISATEGRDSAISRELFISGRGTARILA